MNVGLAVPHFGRLSIHPHFGHADNVRISELKSSGKSCGSCSLATSVKGGGSLRYCTCKGKHVQKYNICDKYP